MYRRVLEIVAGIAPMFGLVLPVRADLQNVTGPSNNPFFGNLASSINTIFTFVILIAGIIFVVLFLVGGIQYLTAAGNEEQTGKAKRLLVDAIVGLIIVLLAWAAGNFILTRLGVNIVV